MKKRKIIIIVAIILVVFSFSFCFLKKDKYYSNKDFNVPTYISKIDKDKIC